MTNFKNSKGDKARVTSDERRRGKSESRTTYSELLHPQRGLKFQFVRMISAMLIVTMLVTSSPAAPQTMAESASEIGQDIRYSFLSNFGSIQYLNSLNPILGLFFKLAAKGKPKQQRIARVEVSPGDTGIREGESINFSAVAYDPTGNVVQGVEFEWLAAKGDKEMSIRGGEFESGDPGTYYVGARAAGQIGTTRIVVREDVEFRAMKEIRRQEKEAAESKTGISTGNKQSQNLRKDVLDEVQRIKANPEPAISNSTRMRQADKAALKQWDDSQKVKRRAARDKAKLKRHQMTINLQGSTSEAKDEDSADDEEDQRISSKITQKKAKVAESELSSKIEATSNLRYIISPNEKLADDGLTSKPVGESKMVKKTKEVTTTKNTKKAKTGKSKKPAVFASGMFLGINGSSQAYGVNFYPYPESGGGGGGGGCPPWIKSCGGGSTTYYSEMEIYVDGDRTTGDFVGLYPCAVQQCSSWTVNIPTDYQDGQSHTARAYIVNDNGTQVVEASGSPKTFIIAQPPEWTNANWDSSDDPGVQVGTPRNNGTSGAGSGNFGFSAPVVSLPGRNGLDVNLSLNYNSLLWHQDPNSNITYDIDKGSPAPGWNIGFGKLMNMDTTGGAMLESSNGTRHSYDGEIVVGAPGYSTYYGRTTDGSFIDYIVERGPNGLISGEAWMPNGTKVTYESESDGVLYPTKIKDANGNYITIAYVGGAGPNIYTITDTLGRVITFKYANGRLINIEGPGYNGTTQTFVRLHYTQQTLSATFSGLNKAVRDASPYQLKAIYYPETDTGYWFGDGDSYSSYGMIKKVLMNRSMTSSGTTTTEGVATAGSISSQSSYDYPATASNLTSAPKYSTKSDTWYQMDTSVAVTSYAVNNASSPRTTTITLPNGTKNKTSSYNTSDWKDGMLDKTEFLAPNNTVLSKQDMIWEQGFNDVPRITEIQSTDEKNQTKKQTFTYGSLSKYNQVTIASEYGYSSNLLRKAVTTYQNDVAYIGTYTGTTRWISGPHIFSLPLITEIRNASDIRMSRVDFTYDVGTMTTRSGVSNFDTAYNTSSYTTKRGNVTKTTTYTNAAVPTGAIDYLYTYDVLGNNLTATTNCCQQMTTTYEPTMKYAYPESVRRGAPTGSVANTAYVTYDFNTGLVKTSTDYNNRITTAAYDTIGRPTQVTLENGAKTNYEYDPDNLTTIQTARLDTNVIVSKSTSIVNGRGQPRISKLLTGASSETATQVKYDIMGRQSQVSNPYPATGSATKWTIYTYDNLSRVTQTTAPDGSTSKTFYNEATKPSSGSSTVGSTVRSQDAWGRERWARSDDWGRLVEVVEPDPNGNGSVFDPINLNNVQTAYTYDAVDQLTLITQGVQERKFKYDSLGRMTRQKLAEQTATINDAGNYVVTGGVWSDAFEYDSKSNLIKRTDARGVKTNFNYNSDPLNRLQGITFDKSSSDTGHGTIHDAGDITYTYMTSGDKERIYTAATAGVSTETYTYDLEGRVSNYKMLLSSRTSYPLETSYLYDTANRLTEVRYPAQYQMSGNPRKKVNVTYDQTSRLKDLKYESVTQMDQISYNDYGQATNIRIGGGSANPLNEEYTFDANTGLMTNQKVKRSTTTLMDLTYSFDRGNSKGSLNGTTGNLTKIVNNLDRNKDRVYEFDTLGRLIKAKGGAAAGGSGATANWDQTYTYDRYGNKLTTVATGQTQGPNPQAIPLDGVASQTYTAATNRITTTGHEYDNAGNQIRGKAPDGTIQRFEFDEAGRIVKIKTDAGADIETNTYATSRERIKKETSTGRTYYAWGGSSVLCEYTETGAGVVPNWAKSYIYAGSRLLSTITKNGSSELTEFQHPDRLGTKAVSDTALNTFKEQATLPFGTMIDTETEADTNQKFTSYDRSGATGLDYAVNRTYNSGQSRFTQVDPIGMASTSIGNPQSLNLFAYTQNNPVDFIDPSGTNLAAPGGSTCYLDGFEVSCGVAFAGLSSGWAVPDRNFDNPWWLGSWEDQGGYEDATGNDTTPNASDGTIRVNGSTQWVSNWVFVLNMFGLFGGGQIINWGGSNDDDIIEQTVEDTKRRLRNNTKCAETVKASSSEDPIDVLDKINILKLPNLKDVAVAPIGAGSEGFIGLGNTFFEKEVGNWTRITGLNNLRTRQFVLLHELMHLSGAEHKTPDQLEIFVDVILRDCFGVTRDN